MKTIIIIYLPECVEILFVSLLIYLFYLPYLHGVTFLHDVYVIFSKSQVRRFPSIITCSKPSLDALLWLVESYFSLGNMTLQLSLVFFTEAIYSFNPKDID